MDLSVSSNSAANPQTLDLTNFLRVSDGEGMDPYDPAFTNKVISHSLLKEGGVLALEDLQAKETVWPVRLTAANSTALATLVQQLNQIITTPGATCSWQDDGMSQPTVFDLISGQFDVQYRFREGQMHYVSGMLRIFSQPLGRTAAPRMYAAASGMAPLLLISPYSPSTGALIIGASTQAGVAGFGGAPFGASSGVFFSGAPSLAGDTSALLGLSVTVAPSGGAPSMAAISLLPDRNYQPVPAITQLAGTSYGASVPGGTIYTVTNGNVGFVSIQPANGNYQSPIPLSWSGNHRILTIARASGAGGTLYTPTTPLIQNPTTASVTGSNWNLYDLGVYSLPASQAPAFLINIGANVGAGAAIDVSQIMVLPDNATWFFRNSPAAYSSFAIGNVILANEFLRDQFIIPAWYTTAPSPIGPYGARITQYSRGLVPRPDPKNGLPVLAVLAFGASCSSPLIPLSAQVTVRERTRYVLG